MPQLPCEPSEGPEEVVGTIPHLRTVIRLGEIRGADANGSGHIARQHRLERRDEGAESGPGLVEGRPHPNLQPLSKLCIEIGQAGMERSEHAFALAIETGQGAKQTPPGDLHPEVGRGRILDVVRLVENQMPIGRKHSSLRVVSGYPAHRQIREEEMVVHDQELGLGRPPAGTLVEAVLEVGTARAQTDVRIALHLVPYLGAGNEAEIGARPVLGRTDPFQQSIELGRPLVREEDRCRSGGEMGAANRNVVAAALEQRPLDLVPEKPLRQRQVFGDELLLEVDGVGGEHRSFAVLHGPLGSRNQIGEGLPCPGARLDQECLFHPR